MTNPCNQIEHTQTFVAILGKWWTSDLRDTIFSDTLKCHCQFARVTNSLQQSVMQRPRGCVQGFNLGFDQPTSQQGNQLWQQSSRDFRVLWGQDNSGDTFPLTRQMGLQKQDDTGAKGRRRRWEKKMTRWLFQATKSASSWRKSTDT